LTPGARRSRPRYCPRPERVAGLWPGGHASVVGLGVSPRCKLVRNPLNLTRDLTELERISGLYGREGRSLAPSHAAALRPV